MAHGPDEADDRTASHASSRSPPRRARGEPMAYLAGGREFFSRPFAVDAGGADPAAGDGTAGGNRRWSWLRDVARRPRLLDLGTGSGVLAVTLALERPDAVVVATDVSAAALAVARANAAALGAGRHRLSRRRLVAGAGAARTPAST